MVARMAQLCQRTGAGLACGGRQHAAAAEEHSLLVWHCHCYGELELWEWPEAVVGGTVAASCHQH